MLQNSAITVSNGSGIGVSGSPVSLGGTVTISNTGVLSLAGTANQITASAGPKTQKRLERKRKLYEQETGIRPARFLLAVGSIASRRAQALRDAGFEVIEPEEDESLED